MWYALGSCGRREWERRGGWAEQCPTEGGTDEVRKKWREKHKKSQGRGHAKNSNRLISSLKNRTADRK